MFLRDPGVECPSNTPAYTHSRDAHIYLGILVTRDNTNSVLAVRLGKPPTTFVNLTLLPEGFC